MSYQQIGTQNYSFGERIFRTAVYQLGVINVGRIEKFLTYFFGSFDPARAERALQAYKTIGAEEYFVPVENRAASIHTLLFRADDLATKIENLEAEWLRLETKNGKILAIIPPFKPTEAWHTFEQALRKFKWEKEKIETKEGEFLEVIVTCPDADLLEDDDLLYEEHLFLHTPSPSVSISMTGRRIGFYLGCMRDICVYDPPGVGKSTSVPSEGAAYEAIETVYNSIIKKHDYKPNRIYLTGACGGNFAAAYLKSLLHTQGVNFIHERGPWDLKKDFIDKQNWLAWKFATHHWNSLFRPNDPTQVGFKIEELWKNLNKSDIGKIIVITIDNDEYLSSPDLSLAERVNKYVFHIHFRSPKKSNPHFDEFIKYREPRRAVLEHIFRSLAEELPEIQIIEKEHSLEGTKTSIYVGEPLDTYVREEWGE